MVRKERERLELQYTYDGKEKRREIKEIQRTRSPREKKPPNSTRSLAYPMSV
jgi:hypothetical protein